MRPVRRVYVSQCQPDRPHVRLTSPVHSQWCQIRALDHWEAQGWDDDEPPDTGKSVQRLGEFTQMPWAPTEAALVEEELEEDRCCEGGVLCNGACEIVGTTEAL